MNAPLKNYHPWLDEFRRAPQAALDGLLRGIANIAPYERAEPVDVLVILFGSLPATDPLHAMLDEALTAWLEARHADGPDKRKAYGVDRYLEDLIQALNAVYRLSLEGTAAHLRQHFDAFQRWLNSLYLDPGRDPAGELWRVVALMQTDRRFLEDWYQLCANAGQDLPSHYLSLGLLGLRLLPEPGQNTPSGRLNPELLAGLFKWAVTLHNNRPDRQAFVRHLRTIKALYPRAPQTWRDLLLPLLKSYNKTAVFIPWLEQTGIRLQKGQKASKPGIPHLPQRERRGELLRRLQEEPLEQVKPAIQALMTDHERYAEATGESTFFVKTACNFAGRLMTRDPHYALELARAANRWEPYNPFTWSHWARALETLGKNDLAEIVYWEALRRFPEDAFFRNQLAHLLARTNRAEEAEALYRETKERFPNDAVSRTALAKLLADSDRLEEAEVLSRDTLKRFPDDDVSRTALAKLLADSDRLEEAEVLYRETIKRFPDNDVTRTALAELLAHTGRAEEAETLYRDTIERFTDNAVSRVSLAFKLIDWGRLSEAEQLYQEITARFPEDNYTRHLREVIEAHQIGSKQEIEVSLPLYEEAEDNAQPPSPPTIYSTEEMNQIDAFSSSENVPQSADAGWDSTEAIIYEPFKRNLPVSRSDFHLRTQTDPESRYQALAELGQILDDDKEHIYARVVLCLHDKASRTALVEQVEAFPHAYPLRFLAASESDSAAWEPLLSDFPRHNYLTLLGNLRQHPHEAPEVARCLQHWVAQDDKKRQGFERAVAQKLHNWLFAGMSEEPDMKRLSDNLETNERNIDILIQDGLKRSVDEGIRYAA